MFSTEFLLMILFYAQNLLLGLIALKGLKKIAQTEGSTSNIAARNSRVSSYRFYECSTSSRGGASLKYCLSFLSVLCAYIVYDVDLIFFLSELMFLADYGLAEIFIFVLYIYFFVIGLWMDYRRVGFAWDIN